MRARKRSRAPPSDRRGNCPLLREIYRGIERGFADVRREMWEILISLTPLRTMTLEALGSTFLSSALCLASR